jgi:hypothetical protein
MRLGEKLWMELYGIKEMIMPLPNTSAVAALTGSIKGQLDAIAAIFADPASGATQAGIALGKFADMQDEWKKLENVLNATGDATDGD